jgi:hypothetical protein
MERSRFKSEKDMTLGDGGTEVGVFRYIEDGDRAAMFALNGIEIYGCQRGFVRAAGVPRWAII